MLHSNFLSKCFESDLDTDAITLDDVFDRYEMPFIRQETNNGGENMKNLSKSNFCIAVAFAAVLSVFMSSSAFGWGKGTHDKLTEQVINNFQKTGWLVSLYRSLITNLGQRGVSRGRIGPCLGPGRCEQE